MTGAVSADLTLSTDRLVLRPSTPRHAPLLWPMMRDPSLSRYLAWSPHQDVDQTRAVLEAMRTAQEQGQAYHWTVFDGETACGLVSLIDVRRRHRLWDLLRAEIAYWVGTDFQGRGYAGEAVPAIIDAAFGPLGLNRLIVSHTSENVASGRIPRRLGFRFVGCEQQFFRKDGRWFDMNHYELLREDWLRRQAATGNASGPSTPPGSAGAPSRSLMA